MTVFLSSGGTSLFSGAQHWLPQVSSSGTLIGQQCPASLASNLSPQEIWPLPSWVVSAPVRHSCSFPLSCLTLCSSLAFRPACSTLKIVPHICAVLYRSGKLSTHIHVFDVPFGCGRKEEQMLYKEFHGPWEGSTSLGST